MHYHIDTCNIHAVSHSDDPEARPNRRYLVVVVGLRRYSVGKAKSNNPSAREKLLTRVIFAHFTTFGLV